MQRFPEPNATGRHPEGLQPRPDLADGLAVWHRCLEVLERPPRLVQVARASSPWVKYALSATESSVLDAPGEAPGLRDALRLRRRCSGSEPGGGERRGQMAFLLFSLTRGLAPWAVTRSGSRSPAPTCRSGPATAWPGSCRGASSWRRRSRRRRTCRAAACTSPGPR